MCVEDVLKFCELNLRLLSRFAKLVYQKMCLSCEHVFEVREKQNI